MEAMGTDGSAGAGAGPRSHREQTTASKSNSYSTCSCSSSGSASTPCTSRSSQMSSSDLDLLVGEPARDLHRRLLELECGALGSGEEILNKYQTIKGLIQEFFAASTPANCSVVVGVGVGVPERWLRELDVCWVLAVGDAAHAAAAWSLQDLQRYAGSWVRALTEIVVSISLAYSYFSDSAAAYNGRFFSFPPTTVQSSSCVQVEHATLDHLQLAQFTEATLSKMLPFVHAIVSWNRNTATKGAVTGTATASFQFQAQAGLDKLQTLVNVRDAMSTAAKFIMSWIHSALSAQAQKINDDMVVVWSEKESNLEKAISDTMVEMRTGILASMKTKDHHDDRSWGNNQTPQGIGSSHIRHKATRYVLSYIKLLHTNYELLRQAIGDITTLTTLKMEMVSCLEQKLAENSLSFPDRSQGLLFLINNLHFIWLQLGSMFDMKFHMPVLTSKIEYYVEYYLEVSWAPVLSLLFNPRFLCVGRHSLLPMFESEFEKTYRTQRLWKVPDPELRGVLRKAIIQKVTPDYRKYLQDNCITNARKTPEELEEILQELFEG